jgi:hypothetical protein
MWFFQWLSFFAAVFGSTRRAANHFAAQVSTVSFWSGTAPPRRRAASKSSACCLATRFSGSVNRFRLPLGSRTT